jgi:hypothetical protein
MRMRKKLLTRKRERHIRYLIDVEYGRIAYLGYTFRQLIAIAESIVFGRPRLLGRR